MKNDYELYQELLGEAYPTNLYETEVGGLLTTYVGHDEDE